MSTDRKFYLAFDNVSINQSALRLVVLKGSSYKGNIIIIIMIMIMIMIYFIAIYKIHSKNIHCIGKLLLHRLKRLQAHL